MGLLLLLALGLEPVALHNVSSGQVERIPIDGGITVITFVSAVCPVSSDYGDRMAALYREYSGRARFLFVNSNHNEPVDMVRKHARASEYPFPVYRDVGNVLADRLGATMTPQAFVLDHAGQVRYRGHIEDSRNPARTRVRGLGDAIASLLEAKPVTVTGTKAFGCTIKRLRKTW